VHYTEEDSTLLSYVAQHILTALARKKVQAELERRVQDRTHELAAAVAELREQILVRERAEQQLVHENLHDSLTGLPNRNFLYGALDRALARLARDPAHRFAVLFLDLDRFKEVNDTLGHVYGDDLLRQVALTLSSVIRPGDTVSRYAGDEFVLLLPNCDHDEAQRIAGRAQHSIAGLVADLKDLRVGASVGTGTIGVDGWSGRELLHAADQRMYENKFSRRPLTLTSLRTGLPKLVVEPGKTAPLAPVTPTFEDGRRWPVPPAERPRTAWRLMVSYWRIASAERPIEAPRVLEHAQRFVGRACETMRFPHAR
jgi:diguanylate cyclase (GGDEF)-like protein